MALFKRRARLRRQRGRVFHIALTLLVDLLDLQFAASSRSAPVGQQHHGHTDARLLMTTQKAPSPKPNEGAA